jgi:hypothetical protein
VPEGDNALHCRHGTLRHVLQSTEQRHYIALDLIGQAINYTLAVALCAHGAAAQKVSFQAAGGELDLGKPASFLGSIMNLGTMDQIDLLSTPATSLAFAGGKLTVDNGTTTVVTLAFGGTYTTGNFVLGVGGRPDQVSSFLRTGLRKGGIHLFETACFSPV